MKKLWICAYKLKHRHHGFTYTSALVVSAETSVSAISIAKKIDPEAELIYTQEVKTSGRLRAKLSL